ncbi:MAG: DUF3313 family protein [Verrucomicrobiaceae bacterium]
MTLLRAAILILLSSTLLSCRTAKSVIAAVDVKPSGFLPHGKELKENRARSPFIGNWWNTDPKVVKAAEQVKSIYIAPVVASDLRPMHQKLARLEYSDGRRRKKLEGLLAYTREKFTRAFQSDKKSRYAVVQQPAKDAMTLELSFIEWEPNTYTGLLAREAVDLVTLPMVGSVLGKPARGTIAIEGKLIEPKTGQSFFEFADKEEAKTLFFFFPQELFPTGQAKYAIREWARQFEKLMSTPPDHKVWDSMPFQIIAF